MKTITLILMCIMISSCKSSSENTINHANYNNEYSALKEKKIKKENAIEVLDHGLHLNNIHDSIREKIKSKTNETTNML